jgi:hypothetical protein
VAYVGSIGTQSSGSNVGYISNVRVAAAAVYTSNFTPPTTPLGAISGGQNPPTGTQTKLLTCQSNRFLDNSPVPFAMTANGTPRVQAFQPFSPTASYTTALYGGSGYFPSSGSSYLTSTITALSNTFVVMEFWVYNNSFDNSAGNHYLQIGTATYVLSHNGNGQARFLSRNDSAGDIFDIISASGILKLNQWQYVVGIRNATTASLYVDGTRVGTLSVSTSSTSSTALYVSGNAGTTRLLDGYIANARIISGSLPSGYDPTSTTIAVPTTPLTAVTNTRVLLNFTNAGIYDAAVQNDITTVADAKTDTTIKQWPLSSVKFDGTGDFLRMVDAPVFDLGSSDFTIEAWVYTASSGNQIIYSRESPILNGMLFQVAAGLTLGVNLSSNGSNYTSSGLILTGGSITASTWTYAALTRVGSGTNNIKLFLGATPGGSATQVAQGTFSGSIYNASTLTPIIGARNTNAELPFNGYIQDFRFTRGVGRTISTVPSASFPTR